MSGRRTHKINFTAPYFPDSSQICDKPFVLIPFRSHPSGTVRPICGKGRNKILRTTTCLIFHWLDKHRSRSTGRINRIRLNFFPSLHLTQSPNSIQAQFHRTNRTVFIELQAIYIGLPVGTAAAELQVCKIIMVFVRIENTTMSRPEDTLFVICSRHNVLLRVFVRPERRNLAHHISILVFLIPSDSIQIIIDAFPFEEYRAFFTRSRNHMDNGIHRNHIFCQFSHMPTSPKHIGLPVVIYKHFRVDTARIFCLQQGRSRVRFVKPVFPASQLKRTLRMVGNCRIHITVHRRVNVILSISLDNFTGSPVLLSCSRREICPVETPMHEIPGLPYHRRPGCFQPPSISVCCGITIKHTIDFLYAGVCNHIRNQSISERIHNLGVHNGNYRKGLS